MTSETSIIDTVSHAESSMSGRRIATYVLLSASLCIGYGLLRGSIWHGSTQLHTLMELAATLLALFVGLVAIVHYYSKKSNTFLFIGTGFLGTAMLDGYHAIVTSTFFNELFPSPPPSLIPWSWLASRIFLSVLLFFSWLAWRQEELMGEAGRISEKAIYAGVGLFTIASFLFFAYVPLPDAYQHDMLLARPQELVPAMFFLAALAGYLKQGKWRTEHFEHWLVMSLIVGFLGQAMFMSSSSRIFDSMFDSAHLLKKVSYIFVLTGLLISMLLLFKRVETQAVMIAGHNIALTREIQERAKVEERQRLTVIKLDRANHELTQLYYVLYHDLQEPLRMVTSFVQLLERQYKGRLDNNADEFIKYIVDGSSRMKGLLNDMLTYSLLEMDEKKFVPADCGGLCRQALGGLGPQVEESGADISIGAMPTLRVGPNQIRMLFHHLMENAINYRSQEPLRIEVAARHEGGSNEWRFSVHDNGIGIEAQYLDRIFKVFQQLQPKGVGRGNGIGLPICRRIVERHGGRIWVESVPAKGSIFFFTLPALKE